MPLTGPTPKGAGNLDASEFGRAYRDRNGLIPYVRSTLLSMVRATAMLTTSQTASTIAMALGYANAGKFTAAFRRSTEHGRQPGLPDASASLCLRARNRLGLQP